MNNEDIKTLIKILGLKKREDLAELLLNCYNKIDESKRRVCRWIGKKINF